MQRVGQNKGICIKPDRTRDVFRIRRKQIATENCLQGPHVAQMRFNHGTVMVPEFPQADRKLLNVFSKSLHYAIFTNDCIRDVLRVTSCLPHLIKDRPEVFR